MATLTIKLRGAGEVTIEKGRDELVQIQEDLLAGRETPEVPVPISDELRHKEYLVFPDQVTALILDS